MEQPETHIDEGSDWVADMGLNSTDEEEHKLTISRAFSYGEPAGWLRLEGALIHIDIDVGEEKHFKKHTDAFNYVEEVIAAHLEWTGDIYKTHSGVRVLFTHRLAFPDDAIEELDAFEHMDSVYRKGCTQENKFRIRVTPKPNRVERYVAYWFGRFGAIANRNPIAVKFVELHDHMCCQLL